MRSRHRFGFMLVLLSLVCAFGTALGVEGVVEEMAAEQEEPDQEMPNRIYYGGTVGLSFGSYMRISVAPWLGYRLTPKASIGGKVGYEYVRDKRYDETLTGNNYGGSVFTRYRVHPRLYGHAEFAYFSYQYKVSNIESDRDWVPFILLGGGYFQPISPNASFIVEVLFDVLQDDKSPYKAGSPLISVGVGVGF